MAWAISYPRFIEMVMVMVNKTMQRPESIWLQAQRSSSSAAGLLCLLHKSVHAHLGWASLLFLTEK